MNTLIIEDKLMERLTIKSKLRKMSVDELANKYIAEGLDNDCIIPDKVINPDEFVKLLDHDKPEGDDILKRITGIIETDCKTNAVKLKKMSQSRYY